MSATNHAILSWLYNNDFFGILIAFILVCCMFSFLKYLYHVNGCKFCCVTQYTCRLFSCVFFFQLYIHLLTTVLSDNSQYCGIIDFMFFAKFLKGRDQKNVMPMTKVTLSFCGSCIIQIVFLKKKSI